MTEDNQKLVRTVLIIILVLVAGYFLYQKSSFLKKELKPQEAVPKKETASEQIKQNIFVPKVVPAKTNELPEKFPKEISLNGKTSLLQAYNIIDSKSGKIKEAIAVFISDKKLAENYNFYKNWAKDNKWSLIKDNYKEGSSFNALAFKKENKSLILLLEYQNFANKISITYVEE